MQQIILHTDMDRFFCACEEKANRTLGEIPFAVCGDPEMRHSIVMSANSIARQYGVRAGLSFADARRLCPELRKVTADYPKYLIEAKAAREIFRKYSDKIIPYGMDEGWLYLEDGVTWHEAEQIGELIRLEIMYSMGLSASVGISYNLIFSKIASDYRKPNALTVVTRENYRKLIWPLAAKKLLFVGEVRERQLAAHGMMTIGDIAMADPTRLRTILRSKVGYDLWAFANGDDRDFHPDDDRIGSIGNTITPPKDMQNNDEVAVILRTLAAAVCARLTKHALKAHCISIHLRNSSFDTMTRQMTMKQATDDARQVYGMAYGLLVDNYDWALPLRSVGVRVSRLTDCRQLTLFEG